MHKNQRAYELLRWQALAPLTEYDESIDYFSIWKEASDKALNTFDKEHEQQARRDQARTSVRPVQAGSPRRAPDPIREGERLAPIDEEQSVRFRNTRGRKRC